MRHVGSLALFATIAMLAAPAPASAAPSTPSQATVMPLAPAYSAPRADSLAVGTMTSFIVVEIAQLSLPTIVADTAAIPAVVGRASEAIEVSRVVNSIASRAPHRQRWTDSTLAAQSLQLRSRSVLTSSGYRRTQPSLR